MFAGLDTFSTLEYEFTDGYTNKNIDFSGVKDVSHIMHNMGDHYLYGRDPYKVQHLCNTS